METKHTPGPWKLERLTGEHDIGIRVTGPVVSGYTAFIRTRWPHADQQAEQEANARLIVVAPNLLAEVEQLYIELADFRNNWPGRNTFEGQAKLCRLRDLIAKATGRSEEDVQDDYGTRNAVAKATGAP